MAKWVDGFEPSVLTARMARRKSVTGGQAKFPSFDATEQVSVLASKASAKCRSSRGRGSKKTPTRARFDATAAGNVTPDSLLACATPCSREHISARQKRAYRLTTCISADFLPTPMVVRTGKVDLHFGRWREDQSAVCPCSQSSRCKTIGIWRLASSLRSSRSFGRRWESK
jgi:hypothetical protein